MDLGKLFFVIGYPDPDYIRHYILKRHWYTLLTICTITRRKPTEKDQHGRYSKNTFDPNTDEREGLRTTYRRGK